MSRLRPLVTTSAAPSSADTRAAVRGRLEFRAAAAGGSPLPSSLREEHTCLPRGIAPGITIPGPDSEPRRRRVSRIHSWERRLPPSDRSAVRVPGNVLPPAFSRKGPCSYIGPLLQCHCW
ncbi:hypothetical protein MRX96_058316 [Rhipicephalus microplus]